MNDMKSLVKINLPFACAQEFEDPYCNSSGEPAYKLGCYQHEASTDTAKAFFYIFSASLKAAAVPRQKANPGSKVFTDWQHPSAAGGGDGDGDGMN